MTWNYRIIADDSGGDIIFCICEVYYDDEGNPDSYTSPNKVISERTSDVETTLRWMLKATKKDVLWGGDKFPQVFKKRK